MIEDPGPTTSATSAPDAERAARRAPVPRVGAFFDMDKTLIAENSGSVYMKHRYERGEITAWELAAGLGAYLRYKAGVLDLPTWVRSMAKDFAGRDEAELEAEARELFQAHIESLVYPDAAALVRHHQESGHVVVIVSGATRYAVEPLARHLGIEHALFTVLEAEGGVLTGRVVEPVCFEDGKIHWLRAFIASHDVDLARSWFYSDSITDLPLLELVAHPVAVNPDPMLYRTAVRRRWPIRIFAPPEARAARGAARA